MDESNKYTITSAPENVVWGRFDADREPIRTVPQGRTVEIETVTPPQNDHEQFLASAGIDAEAILEDELRVAADVSHIGPGPHVVTGPVAVEGARPGDVLEIRIKDLHFRAPYGLNLFKPDGGVLSRQFPFDERRVIPFDLDERLALFEHDITIPLRPFLGLMAVSPAPSAHAVSTAPPSYFGGNMDLKRLSAGATLYLPVHREGALFWAGDGHGVQGNGEVCLTAAETSLTAALEFLVHRPSDRLRWPAAETDDHYLLLGFDADLGAAMRHALKRCISFLVAEKGLSESSAYRLSSLAVDFNVTQAVNGTKGVHALIPKSLFRDDGPIDPTNVR